MNNIRTLLVSVAIVLAGSLPANAMTFEEAVDSFQKRQVVGRTDEGVLRSLNLAERTAMIGGYKYFLAPVFSETPLQVKLLGTEAGAVELLKPGMKLSVTYGDSGVARIAVIIQQLPPEADIEH